MEEARSYKIYLISVGLAVAFCSAAIFLIISLRTNTLLKEQMLMQARAHFNGIVLTRLWNANYGGVYVEKTRDVITNPYLPGTDITSNDGKVYAIRNPAIMTREISELAGKVGLYTFHITSLNLLNPHNAPDDFERKSLMAFESGDKEVYEIANEDGKSFYRYMAPLVTEKPCLKCHIAQGYKVGDIRGGISVKFSIDDILSKQNRNTLLAMLSSVVFACSLFALIYMFSSRLIYRLRALRDQLSTLAITDGLTNAYNRRYVMGRLREEFNRLKRQEGRLSVIMMDLDDFKRINDTYGHLAGDEVLKIFAMQVKSVIRSYDVLGRYGGEEFLVIMPGASKEEAIRLADRIREDVAGHKMAIPGVSVPLTITVSLGATEYNPSDLSIDFMLKRADDALYGAKREGKNRSVYMG